MALTNLMTAITLDVYDHASIQTSIKSISCDSNTRFVRAALTYAHVPYKVSVDAAVTLTVVRPDGAAVNIEGEAYNSGSANTDRIVAELTDVATAVKGSLLAQFKIEDGDQVLRTEVFKIDNGVALDIDSDKWADTYQGYDLSEFDKKLSAMRTATSEDVGKALLVKRVVNGEVTEWEFGEAGGSSGDDDETRRYLGSTPVTLTEDTNVELVASSNTEYSYGAPIVTDFANREGERLTNATITEGDGYYEVEATEGASAYNESYVRIYLNNLTVGKEYAVNIYPRVNAGEEITGGTCAIYDSAGNPIKVINTVDAPVTDTFVATETSMRLRVLPAGAYFWERGYRKARFTNIIVAPVSDELIASDFSKRENVALTNVTLTEEDGYYEIAATEGATSYANAYADMSFSGLTVGKDYIINVVPNGSSSESASGGLYQFMTFDGDTIGELILLNEAGQLEFTATSNTIRLRLYVASAYLWNNGYTKGRLSSLTITEKKSGTFTGTLDLGILPAGTEIRSTPSCRVYKLKESQKQEEVQKSRHAGKICVCFGDSVTGFLSPPYDYPSVIAEETGMTVYNVGFAGCRMSDTHPYPAYKRFGMVPLVDAIVSGDWSEQDAYVGQIEDGTFPRAHLNNLKNMDWSKVDFATIFYGANDAGNGIPLGDPTGKNTETLLGAFNYAIEKFMTAYPHIKLLILTPIFRYWYDEGKDSDEMEIPEYGTENVRKYYEWGDALMERAKVYKLPTVDMYRTLGINTFNKATYLKNDGAHPRNIGSALIGGKIAGKLLSEY